MRRKLRLLMNMQAGAGIFFSDLLYLPVHCCHINPRRVNAVCIHLGKREFSAKLLCMARHVGSVL